MYTLILKKGKIELELTTDDKYLVEKHLGLIINQASNQKQNNLQQEFKQAEINNDNIETSANIVIENNAQDELKEENQITDSNTENTTQNEVYKEEDIIATGISVTPYNPVTINTIQNPVEPEQPNFDDILNVEMKQDVVPAPVTKDEKFVNYVESKSAVEKLDFLIITAQYLAQYENMNTFNLKHINAKLMQNFTLIVDHSVLQSAISREFITRIFEGNDDTTNEYMLTEKGLRSY